MRWTRHQPGSYYAEFPGDDAVDVFFDGSDAEILRVPKLAWPARGARWQRRSLTQSLPDPLSGMRYSGPKSSPPPGSNRISGKTPFDAVQQTPIKR